MASFDRSARADAFPFACAFARRRFETIGVIVEAVRSEPRLQPDQKTLLYARDERQHGLTPEGAIGGAISRAALQKREAQIELFFLPEIRSIKSDFEILCPRSVMCI
jgi:hypothetical protein